jgi:hypothetical protein
MRLMHGVLAGAALLVGGGLLLADDAKETKKPAKELAVFGSLDAMSSDAAKAKSAEWLKSVGNTDTKTFDAIWAADKTLLDKVAETLALGDADAAKLLAEARNAKGAAPTDVPELLTDEKKPEFFRANLGLAYAKALSNRRVYEEALDTLSVFKPEQVVDPSSFLFHKAVAEHATLKKVEATKSIARLLEDCNDAPERYKVLAFKMFDDMRAWKDEKDKDLGWVGRMMNNIERRLDLSRGGPTTQDQQKRVLLTLDEMIKKLEEEQQKQCQGQCQGQGQGQGNGKPGKNLKASSPQKDSLGGDGGGPGLAEKKQYADKAEKWGDLPPKERAKAALELTDKMSDKHRELIQSYLKKIAQNDK